MDFLQATGLGKLRQGEWVVRKISLGLPAFRKLAIAGETGSGKSSLLQMLAGLINPDEGEVRFEGIRVKKVPEEKLIPGHTGIAYLSQQFELPHHMRVEEILAYSNELDSENANRLYAICQVDHLLTRKHDQVSGGERQRIALARLLSSSPKLLLLDEPYSNLDPIHKETLKAVINDISEKLQMTCILVSHDPLDTISWADEIIVLRQGNILQQDVPEKIYYEPVDEYVAGLFGKYNTVDKIFLEKFNKFISGSKIRSWCIRPNQFAISGKQGDGVKAIVEEVHFLGAGYELLIQIDDCFLTVYTTYNGWKKDQVVFVKPVLGA